MKLATLAFLLAACTATANPNVNQILLLKTASGAVVPANGAKIPSGTRLTIQAQCNSETRSVVLAFDGQQNGDNTVPFQMNVGTPSIGSHTIKATPYSMRDTHGRRGPVATATFTVVLSPTPTATPSPSVSPSPTITPTITPTVTPIATPSPSPTSSPTPTPTATETPSPPPSPTISPSPSPTVAPGAGLASKYPGDVGIGSDPTVLLFDDFEGYNTGADIVGNGKWTGAWMQPNLIIDTSEKFAGNKSLQMKLEVSTGEVANSLQKKVIPNRDTLYLRAYTKFAANYSVISSNHDGLDLRGKYPGAGIQPKPDGTGFFLFTLENCIFPTLMPGESKPGYYHIYAYWPKQRDLYGDIWYQDGTAKPYTDALQNQGEWMAHPDQYPDWRKMPNTLPPLGKWFCYELMVKLNTPGKNDGEVKYWVDGQVAGDFPNLNLRSIPTLQIDEAHVALHALHSEQLNRKWYDNVVLATQYVGPMVGGPQPTPTPSQPPPTPTSTPVPTATSTPNPTATATESPTSTATPVPSPSSTITSSPSATQTPTGKVINAASLSVTDVQAAVNQAQTGDTVALPSGTATWTAALSFTKHINVVGKTFCSTTCSDNTVIVEKMAGRVPFWKQQMSGADTVPVELAGITFRTDPSVTAHSQGALVIVSGVAHRTNMHDLHFDRLQGHDLSIGGDLWGVLHHSVFDTAPDTGEMVYVTHDNWNGGEFGDNSYPDGLHFGTEKWFFIEDIVVNNVSGTNLNNNAGIDSESGGRLVCRHATFNNSIPVSGHGTESGGRMRGQRAAEVYKNKVNITTQIAPGNRHANECRSGSKLEFDNDYTAPDFQGAIIRCYRYFQPFFHWGGAGGPNAGGTQTSWFAPERNWDVLATAADGSHTDGQPPFIFAQGTVTSGSHPSPPTSTMVDNTKNWTPNQWVGYTVIQPGVMDDTGKWPDSNYITASTANSITTSQQNNDSRPINFTPGQAYQIRRVLVCMDQVGRGGGDVVAGTPPVNKTRGGVVDNLHQVLEGTFAWNNRLNGNPFPRYLSTDAPMLFQENRDYYLRAPSKTELQKISPDTPDSAFDASGNYVGYQYPHPMAKRAMLKRIAVVTKTSPTVLVVAIIALVVVGAGVVAWKTRRR